MTKHNELLDKVSEFPIKYKFTQEDEELLALVLVIAGEAFKLVCNLGLFEEFSKNVIKVWKKILTGSE